MIRHPLYSKIQYVLEQSCLFDWRFQKGEAKKGTPISQPVSIISISYMFKIGGCPRIPAALDNMPGDSRHFDTCVSWHLGPPCPFAKSAYQICADILKNRGLSPIIIETR